MPPTAGVKRFRKVLVANRGEIAVRVLRALAEAEIRSAVVYSEPDRASLPVLLSDEAYPIGPAPARESYLRAEAIVELAREIGADAIHPGYGFLSERAEFARLCRDAGVTFIGPSPEAIAAMGSKTESRRRMIAAGVPVVPGGDQPLADLAAAQAAAEEIGYPGDDQGGGRRRRQGDAAGGRRRRPRRRLPRRPLGGGGQLRRRRRSTWRATWSSPRHVEIQVMGDLHGRVVSLGERECSLQRRHQKVVEEAPSPVVGTELRRAHGGGGGARRRRRRLHQRRHLSSSCSTATASFYFLEMNTRLQVEHPVTELVTGIDLVATQLRLAQGEPLGPEFDDVRPHGHAIEVRLYAEDPFHGFAPSPGRIRLLRLPEGPGVRNDCGVYEGAEVTVHYDPMLAKLIVWAADRPRALARLGRALGRAAGGGDPYHRPTPPGAARRPRLPRRQPRRRHARPQARRRRAAARARRWRRPTCRSSPPPSHISRAVSGSPPAPPAARPPPSSAASGAAPGAAKRCGEARGADRPPR